MQPSERVTLPNDNRTDRKVWAAGGVAAVTGGGLYQFGIPEKAGAAVAEALEGRVGPAGIDFFSTITSLVVGVGGALLLGRLAGYHTPKGPRDG